MDSKAVIEHARRFVSRLNEIGRANRGAYNVDAPAIEGVQAQVIEFLRTYAGPKSSFVRTVEAQGGMAEYRSGVLVSVLEGFVDHIESGLLTGVSPERAAQIDVVSELLSQASSLLNEKGIHPAAPTVIIGASLEEFLRTWTESLGLPPGNRKPGLATYAHILREAELIDKQDIKDIESWGGLRNHAAHGEWEKVSDPQRVHLMLEGVNLFMQRYGQASRTVSQ